MGWSGRRKNDNNKKNKKRASGKHPSKALGMISSSNLPFRGMGTLLFMPSTWPKLSDSQTFRLSDSQTVRAFSDSQIIKSFPNFRLSDSQTFRLSDAQTMRL